MWSLRTMLDALAGLHEPQWLPKYNDAAGSRETRERKEDFVEKT